MDSGRNLFPLTPTTFEILLALADRERHGYGILLEIEDRTAGSVRLRPGTLYRALHRLLEQNLVEETEERPDPELDDERRRYYRITADGLAAAQREARRLAQAVASARDKRLLGEGGAR